MQRENKILNRKSKDSRQELLETLYRKTYRIRRAEQAIIEHYNEDDMKTPMHMSMGEEAITAGVCTALKKGDKLFGYYRSHALYISRTDETEKFFGEMYGKVDGVLRGKGGSMHLTAPEVGLMAVSAIVGSTVAPAVGAAFAEKQKRTKNIVAAFFGDGALEEGVFAESLNVACLYNLPVLFVCEDNGLAVDVTAPERQGFRSIRDVAKAFRCDYIYDDTTDAEKIYKLASRARSDILASYRPVFLHLKYYRFLQHIGINNDFDKDAPLPKGGFEKAGYRSFDEYRRALKHDPVKINRNKLSGVGCSPDDIEAIEESINKEVISSIEKAKQAPFPDVGEINDHVFAHS